MGMEEYINGIKFPLIIFYKENECEWLTFWEGEPNKTYSDVFSYDEIKHILTPIAFISEKPNEINFVASFKKNKTAATNKIKVSFDFVIKLGTPLTVDYIIQDCNTAMRNSIKAVFDDNSNRIRYITQNQLKAIISALHKKDENYIDQIKRILYRNIKLNNNSNREYITSTERDALGLVYRINGFTHEIDNIKNWNVSDMATPDYLRGLATVNVREDQLIMSDMRCFGDFKVIREFMPTTCILTDGKKRISIMYANRTVIENNMGVDLIYHDNINRTYIFVQYKRLTERSNKYIYYPSSDSSLGKELKLMSDLEMKLTKDENDYRLNDQVFYFKFCNERQNIQTKELSSGFYLPKDYFLLINELQKEESGHVNISYDTVTRYLTNTVFIELIQYGLIGTKVNDANLISKIINELLANKKSLILATTSL